MVGIATAETVCCLVATGPKWSCLLWHVVVVVDPDRSVLVL